MDVNPMQDYNTTTNLGSIFDAQTKPSTKIVENLREFRDSEADTEWQREAADAMIEYFVNEVKQ